MTKPLERIKKIKHLHSDFTIVNSCEGHDHILLRPDLHALPLGATNVFLLDDGLVVMRMGDDTYNVWYPEDDDDDDDY